MNSILDWFVPETILNERASALQARSLVAIAMIGCFLTPIFLFLEYQVGMTGFMADNAFIGIALALCLIGLKLTGAFYLIRHFMLLALLWFFVHGSFITGSLSSFNTFWLLVFPIMSVFVCGRTQGIIWGFINLAGAVFIGLFAPSDFGMETVPVSAETLNRFRFAEVIATVSCVMLLAYLFEFFKEYGFSQLDEGRRKAETLASQVKRLLGDTTAALAVVDRESAAIAGNAKLIAGSMAQQVIQAN